MRTFYNMTISIAAMCVAACDLVMNEGDEDYSVPGGDGEQGGSSCEWNTDTLQEDTPGQWCWTTDSGNSENDRCCCSDMNDIPFPEGNCKLPSGSRLQCTGKTIAGICESGLRLTLGCCRGGEWVWETPGGGDTGGGGGGGNGGGGGGGGTYCDNRTTACNYVCCERGQYNCCGNRGANCCPSGFPYTDGDSCWPSYEAYCDTICAGTDPNGLPCNCLPLQECNLVR